MAVTVDESGGAGDAGTLIALEMSGAGATRAVAGRGKAIPGAAVLGTGKAAPDERPADMPPDGLVVALGRAVGTFRVALASFVAVAVQVGPVVAVMTPSGVADGCTVTVPVAVTVGVCGVPVLVAVPVLVGVIGVTVPVEVSLGSTATAGMACVFFPAMSSPAKANTMRMRITISSRKQPEQFGPGMGY